MTSRAQRYRVALVLVLLVALHFAVRPFLGDQRIAPDFLMLALLVFALRARPGPAAVAGFFVGLVADALNPDAFGAGALAHTAVGYLAAWGKAVFFAENLVVGAAFVVAGTWLRDGLVMAVGRHVEGPTLWWFLGLWSPLKALTTGLVGVMVLVGFRKWLDVRIAE